MRNEFDRHYLVQQLSGGGGGGGGGDDVGSDMLNRVKENVDRYAQSECAICFAGILSGAFVVC